MNSSIQVEASPPRERTNEHADAKTIAGNGANLLAAASGHGLVASERKYKLSPRRWHFLLAVTMLSVTSTFANEHACLLSLYVESLEMELPDYVNLYQSLFFIPIVVSFFFAQLLDTYGLKPVIWGVFALCCLRNLARILLFSPALPYWRQLRLIYWLLMRGLLQVCYAFFTTVPLKLSELWFPESERSLALSLIVTAPAIGISAASIIYPRLITGLDNCHWLKYCNAGALLVALGGLAVGVRRSEPAEGPPSLRCDIKQRQRAKEEEAMAKGAASKSSSSRQALTNFARQMLRVCRNKNLMIQLVVICLFDPILMAIFIVVQDIFKGAGLSNVFTGAFISFQMLAASVVQLLVAARLRPQRNELDPYNTRTCKLLLLAKMITFILFTLSLVVHELDFLANHAELIRRYQWLMMITSSFAFVVAFNCARPYFNEQTAELILGVTSEANSSACQNAFGSVVFNVIAFAFVRLRQINTGGGSSSSGGGSMQELAPNVTNPSDDFGLLEETTENEHLEIDSSEASLGRPLYLRSVVMVWCVVLAGSLLYLLKFDSSSGRRRERMRERLGQERRASSSFSCHRPDQPDQQQQQQQQQQQRQQVVEIELTKL